VRKVTACRAGRCRHLQLSDLVSIEECDPAVMDFLVATAVGKFLPSLSSGMERPQGLGLRGGIGGSGVIPFLLSFSLSFSLCSSYFLSFSYLSFVSGDEG
jgi:hypothetical protein